MSKAVELLLKFLEQKTEKISEYDYLQCCNILKELHEDQEFIFRLEKRIITLTSKVIELEDNVNIIEQRIKKHDNNEELLNLLYLRIQGMSQCLNELAAISCGIEFKPSIDSNYYGKESKVRNFKEIKNKRGWNF